MKIIALGGLSESGKSYSGKYLENQYSIPRIKIVNYIEKYRKQYFNEEINLEDFHRYLYDNPNKLTEFFLDKFIYELNQNYSDYPFIVIESLRDPFLGEYLKKVLKNDFIIIYLETSLEKRVLRESLKTGLNSSKVNLMVYEKDITKVEQGALKYKQLADYIIENNYSVDKLNLTLNNIVSNL